MLVSFHSKCSVSEPVVSGSFCSLDDWSSLTCAYELVKFIMMMAMC